MKIDKQLIKSASSLCKNNKTIYIKSLTRSDASGTWTVLRPIRAESSLKVQRINAESSANRPETSGALPEYATAVTYATLSDNAEYDRKMTEIQDAFQTVTYGKKRRIESPMAIETSNRFDSLSQIDESENEINVNKTKTNRLPPIILINKVASTKKLESVMAGVAKGGYYVKYTTQNTNIYVKNAAERSALINKLKTENVQFYTYSDASNKTHAFVLKGLDCTDITAEEIKAEINQKIKIHNVYKMKNTARPLYLVVTGAETKISDITDQIKYVAHTRVTWERHYNKKVMIQCHRCQRWGHATANCNLSPKCLKCGESHETFKCVKPKETPAKCANCQKDHPSNSVNCETYQRILTARQSRRTTIAPVYREAPLPQRNPWNPNERPVQNINNLKSFPSLRPTKPLHPTFTQNTQTHTQTPNLTQNTTHTQNNTQNNTNNTSELQDLFGELKKLNSLINISNMLSAVKDLNNILYNCRTPEEKFNVFLSFSQDVSKYNI